METLSKSTQKAKKQHTCNFCELPIKIGEIYEKEVIKDGGIVYTWKNHVKCFRIASELDMFRECYDGVDSYSFKESIRNEYENNLELYYEPINNLKFEEVLNCVCDLRLKPLKT